MGCCVSVNEAVALFRVARSCFCDTSQDNVYDATVTGHRAPVTLLIETEAVVHEFTAGCRAGRLLACGLVNQTTNRKRAKQKRTMTEAHQNQRTSTSPGLPTAINAEVKPKLQLSVLVFSTRATAVTETLHETRGISNISCCAFDNKERNQCRRKGSPPQCSLA